MAQINLFFLKDELLSILEDIQSEITSEYDYLLLKIALVHILAGYPNEKCNTTTANVKINYLIIKYLDRITEFKQKYKL